MSSVSSVISYKPVNIQQSNTYTWDIQEPSENDLTSMWRQISNIINNSARNPEIGVEEIGESKKRLIVPGILLSESEYKMRFGGLDLDYYKKKMPSEIFKVFVRHTGSIRGIDKLDIDELVADQE